MNLKAKHLVLLATLSAVAACGCQAVQPTRASKVSDHEIAVDDAMRMRDWPQISARYEDMSVVAGHNGTMWEYTPEMEAREGWARAMDVPMFVLNTVTMPFSIFYDKPVWREHNSRSPALEPSYHAMPPLPASPARAGEPANGTAEPMSPDPAAAEPAPSNPPMPDPVDPAPAQPAPSEPATRPNE